MVKTAVVADGQVAEVMVGVANDGHGGIWKKRCSGLSSSDKVMKTERDPTQLLSLRALAILCFQWLMLKLALKRSFFSFFATARVY